MPPFARPPPGVWWTRDPVMTSTVASSPFPRAGDAPPAPPPPPGARPARGGDPGASRQLVGEARHIGGPAMQDGGALDGLRRQQLEQPLAGFAARPGLVRRLHEAALDGDGRLDREDAAGGRLGAA